MLCYSKEWKYKCTLTSLRFVREDRRAPLSFKVWSISLKFFRKFETGTNCEFKNDPIRLSYVRGRAGLTGRCSGKLTGRQLLSHPYKGVSERAGLTGRGRGKISRTGSADPS